MQELVKGWGKLPEKDQVKAIQELTRDMPAKHRDVINEYLRKLAASEANKP